MQTFPHSDEAHLMLSGELMAQLLPAVPGMTDYPTPRSYTLAQSANSLVHASFLIQVIGHLYGLTL